MFHLRCMTIPDYTSDQNSCCRKLCWIQIKTPAMESFSLTWFITSTLLKKIRLYRKCFLKIFFRWLFKLLVPFYLCTLPWTILVLYFSHQSSNHIWCSHKGQLLKKYIIIKKCFNIWKELILHYDTILRKCLRRIFWWILQAADLIWLPLGEKFPNTEL